MDTVPPLTVNILNIIHFSSFAAVQCITNGWHHFITQKTAPWLDFQDTLTQIANRPIALEHAFGHFDVAKTTCWYKKVNIKMKLRRNWVILNIKMWLVEDRLERAFHKLLLWRKMPPWRQGSEVRVADWLEILRREQSLRITSCSNVRNPVISKCTTRRTFKKCNYVN